MLKDELKKIEQQDCDNICYHLIQTNKQKSDYTPPLNFMKLLTIAEKLCNGSLKGKTFLDVGCGGGGLVLQAQLLGADALGIDLPNGMDDSLETANKFITSFGFKESVQPHDITKPLPPELLYKFDIVTSVGMLEHIPTKKLREAAVRNMMTALRPGGSLLLQYGPNCRFPLDFFHYGPRYPAYHLLPSWAKTLYLRHIIRPGTHPDYKGALADENQAIVNGVSVKESISAIQTQIPNAEIAQGFPLLVRLVVTRPWLRKSLVNISLGIVANFLTFLHAEPVILIIARRPGNQA